MRIAIYAFVLTCGSLLAPHVSAMSMQVPGYGNLHVTSIQSVESRRFARTIHQQYDFSCGSAAIATLLTYHYDDPVTEQQVFQSMWAFGNQPKIRKLGFSLLDMKDYLQSRGYIANGYKVPLDRLIKQHVPAIVMISDHGYNHFVVVKGLSGNRVLIGDPSRGARLVPRQQFKAMRTNDIVFVITSNRRIAAFNAGVDVATTPMAPLALGSAMSDHSLANALWLRPEPGDF